MYVLCSYGCMFKRMYVCVSVYVRVSVCIGVYVGLCDREREIEENQEKKTIKKMMNSNQMGFDFF